MSDTLLNAFNEMKIISKKSPFFGRSCLVV